MALVILRCVFILVAAGVGFQIIQADTLPKEPYVPWLVVGGLILLAATVIAIDVFAGRKRLDIDHGEAQRPFLQRIVHAVFHRAEILLRHDAAGDAILEHEAFAARQRDSSAGASGEGMVAGSAASGAGLE